MLPSSCCSSCTSLSSSIGIRLMAVLAFVACAAPGSLCFEDVLQLVEEASPLGHRSAVFRRGVLVEELALLFREALGDLDQHLDELVAGPMRSHVGQSLAPELEDLAVLRTAGDIEVFGAFK